MIHVLFNFLLNKLIDGIICSIGSVLFELCDFQILF